MTERIRNSCATAVDQGRDIEPCLVVDLEVVRDNYQTFAKALPDKPACSTRSRPIPRRKCCRCWPRSAPASTPQPLPKSKWRWRRAHRPDRISYGNTIEKERDIARAFALGIRLFAVDCTAEVEKIARAAPGARVFCRILYDCAGAEWPLSRKFGCDPEMAVDVPRSRQASGARAVRHLVPCRLAAAQGEGMGSRAGDGLLRVSRLRGARDQPHHGQHGRRLPRPATSRMFRRSCNMAGRSSARCASISATRSRRPSSSPDAAWSAMPASSSPRSS